MAEQYRPKLGYWLEVAILDRQLFRRGERRRELPEDAVFETRYVQWHEEGIHYAFSKTVSPLLTGRQNLGSEVWRIEELHVGGIRSLGLGTTGLARRVSYVPFAIYTFGSHMVTDHTHTLDQFDQLTKDAPTNKLKAVRAEIHKDQELQQPLGLLTPTKETYLFILDTLKQGEKATR